MTSKKSFSGIVFLITFLCSLTVSARDYYQIKVYTIKNKTQETRVENFLEDAYLPAMHKAGIKTIGVFKPNTDDKSFGTKIFVFIPLSELAQIEEIEAKLADNKKYLKAGSDYIDAKHDDAPYERIESILLKAFADEPAFFTPKYDTPKNKQVFELRSYESATEKIWRKKVHMFNEGGETKIFKNVGSNAIFYGEVIAGSTMPNLMYMISSESMESNEQHWEAFRKHPDWEILKSKEEYANTVSHIDKWMLFPTDYSDL